MKQLHAIVFFLAIFLLVTACKKEKVGLNQEFNLKFNKSAIVNINGVEHEIKFSKLVGDSRCQPGHMCYVAGSATIEVTVDKKDVYQLGIMNDIPSSIQIGNHSLAFLDVKYSKGKNHGVEKQSLITLLVQ